MTTFKSRLRLSLSAAALATAMAAGSVSPVLASGGGEIERQHWSFAGMFGTFDNNQLQRGFKVYREVCASCHSLSRIAFRNLAEKGGPEFPVAGVTSLAATYKVQDGPNDDGKMFSRPAKLSDRLPSPFKNEQEARATNNGSLPPDLSLMAKARNPEYTGPLWYHPAAMLKDIVSGYQEGGADYIYALMTSYHENAPAYRKQGDKMVAVADKDVRDPKAVIRCATMEHGEAGKPDTCNQIAEGMHYNTSFAGRQIAMAKPLIDGQVTYADGTPATVQNYAKDVAAFLSWTADPTLEARKSLGWQVMLYLLITTILLYFGKRAIWRDAH